MSVLKSIKNELQHIIEAMNAVTSIDITIVDENMERIVATGILKEGVGQKAPVNSVFHSCLTTGQQYFIETPTVDSMCINCTNHSNCRELVEMCIPIKFNDEIIGVLGMCAFDRQAQQNLINNKESYIRFESQLGNIISTMLSEKKFGMMLEYRSSELLTLINSLNEGIIIMDNNNDVITTNKYIVEKLHLRNECPFPIKSILPAKVYEKLISNNFCGEIGPVNINGYEFIINANPILIKNEKTGIILVFSDFKKMRESVLNSAISKNLITFDYILGESEAFVYARQQAIQVAQSDVSVMLIGETGTGKEMFARAIHAASRRKNNIFLPINCGAIPENLIESELFGYEKGSFTGANATGKIGKFEICKDGTLFLDEIGDLPYAMQVKLLRALEEKEIIRVGGHTPIKVNPRIISACHGDLKAMVEEGTFREDLYYRLNVVPIFIPPLRERGYDIIILSRYFLKHFSQVYNKDLKGFTEECENFLMSYTFPGNIRELRNLIEYAVIFEESNLVGTENIRKKLGRTKERNNMTLGDMVKAYEKKIIESYLQHSGNSLEAKREVARQLGISIATLYRKLES
ncbi:sigma-54 interaction domain-containing protein [Lutispora thermophila]|uniref:Transcriptional regulator containing PAS, AAA-type ATPase, and DNA-binding Fis domains n=1 Tax=Lutispora thermophila DSM 19022 TaxID=1122184 RepID=A0A1M6H0D3_9FIRM|nr:sigma 54-interacting transcriptional regulator [Lutispora thermophila]SHJ15635.1 Transcriptional regulator containing PAS, AAA-type ATPase, and DNA-binding Fis domains [Lutispora thermophila DSM 19022]